MRTVMLGVLSYSMWDRRPSESAKIRFRADFESVTSRTREFSHKLLCVCIGIYMVILHAHLDVVKFYVHNFPNVEQSYPVANASG